MRRAPFENHVDGFRIGTQHGVHLLLNRSTRFRNH